MSNRRKYSAAGILLALLVFIFLGNYFWLKKDNIPDAYDVECHLIESIKFQTALKSIIHSSLFLTGKINKIYSLFISWRSASVYWPPLAYFLAALVNPGHFHLFAARLFTNFVFYFLLIVCVYFISKKCFNRKTGLIAGFLAAFYPVAYAYSRQFGLDFPLAGMVSLSLCFLLYSEHFSKLAYSLLFGLALGLSTLIKPQAAIFLLAPFFLDLFHILIKKKEMLNRFRNLLLGLGAAFFIFYLYWKPILSDTIKEAYMHAFCFYPFYKGSRLMHIGSEPIAVFSMKNLFFYPIQMVNFLSLPALVLFSAALIKFMRRESKWKCLFLSSMLVPYLIFTFSSVKCARYILPVIIFFAIITAWFMESLKKKSIKRLGLAAVIAYFLGLYLLTSWSIPYGSIPFLTSSRLEIEVPGPMPPKSQGLVADVEKNSVIHDIRKKIDAQGAKVKFIVSSDEMALPLYLFFQDYLHDDKVRIQIAYDENETGILNGFSKDPAFGKIVFKNAGSFQGNEPQLETVFFKIEKN